MDIMMINIPEFFQIMHRTISLDRMLKITAIVIDIYTGSTFQSLFDTINSQMRLVILKCFHSLGGAVHNATYYRYERCGICFELHNKSLFDALKINISVKSQDGVESIKSELCDLFNIAQIINVFLKE